ncbi:unnamed protein product [Cuscuta epithymum]|uniref:Uncharacterized protein n=1 Tax=Cuscuta epithymum TaxID=186058 RepID=A0AAV0C990_9ASTE|nr:unnamed protein product [Cuscuta epithymum]
MMNQDNNDLIGGNMGSQSNLNLPGFMSPFRSNPVYNLDNLPIIISNGDFNFGGQNNNLGGNVMSEFQFQQNFSQEPNNNSGFFTTTDYQPTNDVYFYMPPSEISCFPDHVLTNVDSSPQTFLNQEPLVPLITNNSMGGITSERQHQGDDYSLNYVVSMGMQQQITAGSYDIPSTISISSNNSYNFYNYNSNSNAVRESPTNNQVLMLPPPPNYNSSNIVLESPRSNPVFELPPPSAAALPPSNIAFESPKSNPVIKLAPPPTGLPPNSSSNYNNNSGSGKRSKNSLVARKNNPISSTTPQTSRVGPGRPRTRNTQRPSPSSSTSSSPSASPASSTLASNILGANQFFNKGLLGHYQALANRGYTRSSYPYLASSSRYNLKKLMPAILYR